MKTSSLLAATALLALPFALQAQAALPMFNGTCPGGLEVHADDGGPVYVNGKETRLKRFNDDYVEAHDPASGVTLSITTSAGGGVQMSYTGHGGANGVCSVGRHDARGGSHDAPAGLPREVTCESQGNTLAGCNMDTRGDVELVRQLSRTECVEGRNWGLSRNSVWVKDGCRAVFRNTPGDGGHQAGHGQHRGYVAPVAAADGAGLLGACNRRARASGALVTRVPVNDEAAELIIDYPDGRYLCMARNDGQVMSLTRLQRQPK